MTRRIRSQGREGKATSADAPTTSGLHQRFTAAEKAITLIVTLAAVAISYLQFRNGREQTERSLALQAASFDRDWQLRAGALLAEHSNALFSKDPAERARMQQIIQLTFPDTMVVPLFATIAALSLDSTVSRRWSSATVRAASVQAASKADAIVPSKGIVLVQVTDAHGQAIVGFDVYFAPAMTNDGETWQPERARAKFLGHAEDVILDARGNTPARYGAWVQVRGGGREVIGFQSTYLEDIDEPVRIRLFVPDSVAVGARTALGK